MQSVVYLFYNEGCKILHMSFTVKCKKNPHTNTKKKWEKKHLMKDKQKYLFLLGSLSLSLSLLKKKKDQEIEQ